MSIHFSIFSICVCFPAHANQSFKLRSSSSSRCKNGQTCEFSLITHSLASSLSKSEMMALSEDSSFHTCPHSQCKMLPSPFLMQTQIVSRLTQTRLRTWTSASLWRTSSVARRLWMPCSPNNFHSSAFAPVAVSSPCRQSPNACANQLRAFSAALSTRFAFADCSSPFGRSYGKLGRLGSLGSEFSVGRGYLNS